MLHEDYKMDRKNLTTVFSNAPPSYEGYFPNLIFDATGGMRAYIYINRMKDLKDELSEIQDELDTIRLAAVDAWGKKEGNKAFNDWMEGKHDT